MNSIYQTVEDGGAINVHSVVVGGSEGR